MVFAKIYFPQNQTSTRVNVHLWRVKISKSKNPFSKKFWWSQSQNALFKRFRRFFFLTHDLTHRLSESRPVFHMNYSLTPIMTGFMSNNACFSGIEPVFLYQLLLDPVYDSVYIKNACFCGIEPVFYINYFLTLIMSVFISKNPLLAEHRTVFHMNYFLTPVMTVFMTKNLCFSGT